MSRASVLGMGQVSAVGAGLDALRSALTGAFPSPQSIERWPGDDGPHPTILRARCDEVRGLVPSKIARRLDGFGLGALGAALLALEDAGRSAAELAASGRVGVVVATGFGALGSTFGFLHDVVTKADGLSSPLHFSRSVHNAPAFSISSTLQTRGPTTTMTGFSLAWPRALATALDWLDSKTVDSVLLCSADEQHPVVVDALADTGVSVVKDRQSVSPFREAYLAGETYTALLLSPAASSPPESIVLCAPSFFDVASDHDEPPVGSDDTPLLLATQGLPGEAAPAVRLARAGRSVGSYAAIWGANPTADAMSAVTAALSLRDRRLYPLPASVEGEATPKGVTWLTPTERPDLQAIECVSIDGEGRAACLHIECEASVP